MKYYLKHDPKKRAWLIFKGEDWQYGIGESILDKLIDKYIEERKCPKEGAGESV